MTDRNEVLKSIPRFILNEAAANGGELDFTLTKQRLLMARADIIRTTKDLNTALDWIDPYWMLDDPLIAPEVKEELAAKRLAEMEDLMKNTEFVKVEQKEKPKAKKVKKVKGE